MLPYYERTTSAIRAAEVYRFNDKVALNIAGAPATVYLTKDQARKLATAMQTVVENIAQEANFSKSTLKPIQV